MRTVMALAFLLLCGAAFGQNYQMGGVIVDENAKPLASAVVVLLNPADSTLLYFSVTGSPGRFEMKNIRKGPYLLQVSLLGFSTIYRRVDVPLPASDDLGTLMMIPKVFNIGEVAVTADRIPLRIKNDTIEYDAKAYKVKPDAVAEDLIRKLPGIEVDRAGNIKALGEDVKDVLVDGKEFFGGDTKVATKNLPADAIDRVQLFDRKSDESRFTGIDDGERDPTLNLVLDEKKKGGIFGEVEGGAATGNHAEASAKVYRFTKKLQVAALGMFNNVNKPGFSLGDYISFSGGLSSLSDGGGHIALGGENSFPVNFGQPVYGTGSNGAAGLNFSISKSQDNRFFMSYLGNGSKRQISETSRTLNFSPGNSFRLDESKEEIVTDTTHRFNIGLRKMIGSNQNIIMNGAFSWNESSNPVSSVSGSFLNDVQVNSLQRTTSELPDRLSGTADASYLLRINEGRSIFKISGKVDLAGNSTCSEFLNRTEFLNPYREEITNQFYDVRSAGSNYSGTAAFTRRLSGRSSAELSLTAGYSVESIGRKQGNVEGGKIPDPELSPDFRKTDRSIRPGITWKLATRKSQLSLSGFATLGRYSTMLNGDGATGQDYFYLTPRAHWEYEYRSGRRLMFSYTSSVNTPSASRLLPVVNNINPLSLLYGNLNLKPEYIHNARLTWWLFDQYSFTTLLTGLSFNYTRDKIGYMRDIDENLAQVIRFINVSNDWDGSANLDFSTPVKPFGLKVDLSVSETVSRGLTVVNQAENIFRSFAHRISLTLENRKKNKWDIQTGSAFTLTDSRYSVARSMNNVYRDLSWFSEVRFTPGVHLNFMASADITNYTAKSFNESQVVPLVGAEVNFCFLRNQRGVLTLKGVDLLNRNSGIERNGELNYLTERRSSMIGRYIMLAFSYRLNKLGDNKGGVDVRIRNH